MNVVAGRLRGERGWLSLVWMGGRLWSPGRRGSKAGSWLAVWY